MKIEPPHNGNGNGHHIGTITLLEPGVQLQVCGDGFNARTVKVRWRDSFYYVFRADIAG